MTILQKKIIRLSLLFILLIIIIVVAVQLLNSKDNSINKNDTPVIKQAPATITLDERKEMGIADDLQIEVMNRDDEGKITTYRVVK